MNIIEKYFKALGEESWFSLTDGKMMFEYTERLLPGSRIVEIGTGAGHSTGLLSLIRPMSIIYTIDNYGFLDESETTIKPVYDLRNGISEIKKTISLPNVIQVLGNSATLPWELPVDFLFIDGDHSYEGCANDFNNFAPFVKIGCFIMFHDYWRKDFGVGKFVDELPQDQYKLIVNPKSAIVKKLI